MLEKDFTIQRDIKSISAVNKLRGRKKPNILKEAGYILITTNSSLAYANKCFEIEEYGKNFFIPVCLTDIFIGTLIWLEQPSRVEELNKKKIIADCFAALKPNRILLKKFLDEVETLRKNQEITEDDYYLLRSSSLVRESLTEKTMGDTDNFVPKTSLEILSEIKRDAYKEVEEEKKRHMVTKDSLEREIEEKEQIQNRLDKRAENLANTVSKILFLTQIAIVIAFIVLQFTELKGKSKLLLIIIAVIIGIANLIYGLNVKDLKKKTKIWIKDKILNLFLK